ncbi:MAG: hypothetical protein A3B47_04265 [Candidatus Levybacteria bacterium RIFCSPLOWO2_01_FULL_39_24]|nr:MAG: hypothetical protein A2800_04545 [Candidatus Levybacteria bacterium RIFCSPHIGHO2_01_FULL_40_16]OGH28903.1 MAG: hypothetical protein A3E12_04075 [Candidatus Levybacteria bacterium RIFCSPHIGHO2_12_FULL_39_9]OGH45881.1 MAG: hypothetical protein A3B47_04265 [Candidatus Levybacteria bacterium RIFCSPLOWO2_01_FULL_39_24]
MAYFVLLLLEIVILFFLSRSMSKTLSKFMSINLISFLLLPGMIIHELAHLFIAVILFVPVGDMEFAPKKNGNGVKLGSVEIAKTDPIRRSIIGFAPIFAGLVLVVSAVYLFSANILFWQKQNLYLFTAVILILIYLLFAISNTMFASKRDMEGTVEILITLITIFIGAYILGFRFPMAYLDKIFTKELLGVIQKSSIFLLAPITIDVFILGAVKLFTNSRSQRS